MTWTTRSGAAGVVIVLAAGLGLAAQQPQSPPPMFHAATALVSVDVSVRRGNVPMAGLTTADFALTDNGVAQHIDALSIDAVPVDVTLVVDLSGSTAWRLERYRSDIVKIAELLRPVDRLRLIAFDSDVTQIFPLQASGTRPPVETLETGNYSSVFDGISAALLRQPELDRRHLIVGFTDGADNRSILTARQLLEVAKRAESVLHVVGLADYVSSFANEVAPSRDLRAVAEATGGAAHGGSILSGSMVGDFKKIFDEFRQSYVLRFHPAGVPATGWHDLSVNITRSGKYDVKARKGYFGG